MIGQTRVTELEQQLWQLSTFIRTHVDPAAVPPSCAAIINRYDSAPVGSASFIPINSPLSHAVIKKQRVQPERGGHFFPGGSAAASGADDPLSQLQRQSSTSPSQADDDEDQPIQSQQGRRASHHEDEEGDENSASALDSSGGTSLYYHTTTSAAATSAAAAANSASSNPFCKPCPLLTNLSKHPLRVTYVDIPREYTMSKKDAATQLSVEERLHNVRVPIRIMGRPLGAHGEECTNIGALIGRIPRSDVWIVSKDICAVLHIRKGNVAKVGSDCKTWVQRLAQLAAA